MAKLFQVEIVTPDRQAFHGEVESLRVPAYEGELGVLAGHAPLLCLLKPGAILLRTGNQLTVFAVGGGFMEVSGGKAVVLADSAEPAESIDRARAEKAVSRAKERLHHREKGLDVARAEAALARALSRLSVSEKYGAASGVKTA